MQYSSKIIFEQLLTNASLPLPDFIEDLNARRTTYLSCLKMRIVV